MDFVIKQICTSDIEKELSYIGFDEGYRLVAADKFRYKNIKIYNLTSAQANIIKQTALTLGADCATHREVIRGGIDLSNVILGGSISQIKKISEKLKFQPFNLKTLGEELEKFLTNQNKETKIVGILNITPDSFSDGGKYFEPEDAQNKLLSLIADGADMIDIGAESTRPFSEAVPAKEQIERLKPILDFIAKENIQIPISIDTRSAEVAAFAMDNGAEIINDVSGFDYDKNMAKTVAKYGAGIIIQHSLGTPDVMQIKPKYENLIEDIFVSLKNKVEFAKEIGIKNIIADVGIGFGKTKSDNFEILNRIEEFYSLGVPVMAGVSRKSFLGVESDDNKLKDSLTAAVSYPLMQKNIDYLRVHNVKLHKIMLSNLFLYNKAN